MNSGCSCFLGGWKQAELQCREGFQWVAAHPCPGCPGPVPIYRWGAVPRGHEGLTVTRALFGAGVLWVESRNSDQVQGGLILHTRVLFRTRPLSSEWMGWN